MTIGWANPKTDWDPDDVPSDTHFNRIEGNTLVLARSFEIASVLPEDIIGRPGIIYKTSISVPNSHALVLHRWRACITDGASTPITPKVQVAGEVNSFIPSGPSVDEVIDFTLYTNTTGSTQLKTLQVVASAGDLNGWEIGSGFVARLEIIDTV